MKKYIKKWAKIIICIFMIVCLVSCSDATELNKIAIVMGVGIDKVKGMYPVQMTLQIANVSGIKNPSMGSGDGGTGNAGYIYIKEKGESISRISKLFARKLNRKLFYSHNQVIILSKDIAEDGIEKYIDFFLRYRQTRLLVWILVSKGHADEILNVKPELETNPGKNIGDLVRNEQDISQIPAVDLKEFVLRLMSKTTAPVAPMIEIRNDKGKKMAYLSDTAVFKKDKMVGTLNKKETRGLLWSINKVKDGVIVLNKADGNNVNIEITRSKGKIIPKMNGDKPSIEIKIKEEGDLEEQTFSEDLANPKELKKLEETENKYIKTEIMMALKKSRELNADIFGFGDIIYEHYPKQWSRMEKDWNKVYKNIDVNVSVDAKIRKTGRITKPILSKEK
ncbi:MULTISPECIES: Ger(x)C family spore germination protein [Clostridium]|uniref:Ger(x)C family spore germination protein n=1 Tax=Clostridium TaxID=1485 RepID=UPI0008243505|nr:MULTISPECIES: Ger(x)C family spore germination protein [Clostridium]PJI07009.1 Ger(x)C family spore germination protein [Clostridium sp. CT7]